MKVNTKRLSLLVVTTIMAATLWMGCGATSDSYVQGDKSEASYSSSASSDYGYDYYEDAAAAEEPVENESAQNATQEVQQNPETKLIKNVDMNVETKSFDSLLTQVQNEAKALGGYVESLETYNGSSYLNYREERYSNLTIRIPQEKLDVFLGAVAELGNVTRKTESVQDVTLTYVDLVSHKQALEAEQTRLLELMEQAQSLEDTLTIEERLTDIRYQLESMESQLRTLNNQVNYSTVTMCINEVEVLTPVEQPSIGERISTGFVDSLRDVGDGIKEFFIGFIIAIPYLIVWAIVIILLIAIVKMIISIRQKRKNKKQVQDLQKQMQQPNENSEVKKP